MNKQSAASKVREVALQFLESNAGKKFKRKELEDFIDQRLDVTQGEKTGSLNRLLLEKGSQIGISQLERGVYLYDPAKREPNTLEDVSITEQLQEIMDDAFEKVKDVINSIHVVDVLTEDDLDQLAKYRELLKMKPKIDEILGNKE
jgi:hypothetical protein